MCCPVRALGLSTRAHVTSRECSRERVSRVPHPWGQDPPSRVAQVQDGTAVRYLALALLASVVLELSRHKALLSLRRARQGLGSDYEDVEMATADARAKMIQA